MSHALSLRLQALGDLLVRYAALFRDVWKERESLDAQPRLPHEAQFLPAALELQDTPVSPAPRMAMWLLIAFAVIALLWAIFGHMDVVATAQGKIVPNDGTKVIQPFETATVKAIHVTDGQLVKAGDVLVELDTTDATADSSAAWQRPRHRQTASCTCQGHAGRHRFRARARARSCPASGQSSQALEQRVLEGQYAEYRAKLFRIDADNIRRRQNSLHPGGGEQAGADRSACPAAGQGLQELVDKKFVSEHGYLEREQARIEQEGDLPRPRRAAVVELAAAARRGESACRPDRRNPTHDAR